MFARGMNVRIRQLADPNGLKEEATNSRRNNHGSTTQSYSNEL